MKASPNSKPAETASGNILAVLADSVAARQGGATVTGNEVFIKAAFESDPKSGCELLFRYYYEALCSHAVRSLYSKQTAEDLVSEIFYQFYLNKTYLKITSSYRAYLYKAVRNRAYNYLRWESNRNVNLDGCPDFADSVHQQPDAIIRYEELFHEVEAAINLMPAQRRKIYLMHRFENMKYAGIAHELNISPRTVEVQIRKASCFLKEVLKKKGLLFLLLIVYYYA